MRFDYSARGVISRRYFAFKWRNESINLSERVLLKKSFDRMTIGVVVSELNRASKFISPPFRKSFEIHRVGRKRHGRFRSSFNLSNP